MNNKDKGMSLIVKTAARLSVGFIFIYGMHIIFHGHISPGGGFAGGMIIALAFIFLTLAYGKETSLKKLPRKVSALIEDAGMIILLAIALLGFTGGYFFMNFISKGEPFRIFSAGIIPLCNAAISLKAAAGVFAIFIALILLKEKDVNL